MSADPTPQEIVEVRVSRQELLVLKRLAIGLGAMIKNFENPELKTETRAMLITLMAVIHRAEHS